MSEQVLDQVISVLNQAIEHEQGGGAGQCLSKHVKSCFSITTSEDLGNEVRGVLSEAEMEGLLDSTLSLFIAWKEDDDFHTFTESGKAIAGSFILLLAYYLISRCVPVGSPGTLATFNPGILKGDEQLPQNGFDFLVAKLIQMTGLSPQVVKGGSQHRLRGVGDYRECVPSKEPMPPDDLRRTASDFVLNLTGSSGRLKPNAAIIAIRRRVHFRKKEGKLTGVMVNNESLRDYFAKEVSELPLVFVGGQEWSGELQQKCAELVAEVFLAFDIVDIDGVSEPLGDPERGIDSESSDESGEIDEES